MYTLSVYVEADQRQRSQSSVIRLVKYEDEPNRVKTICTAFVAAPSFFASHITTGSRSPFSNDEEITSMQLR